MVTLVLLFSCAAQAQEFTGTLKTRLAGITTYNDAVDLLDSSRFEEATRMLYTSVEADSLLRKSLLLLYEAAVDLPHHYDSVAMYLERGKSIFKEDDVICFYLGEIYRKKEMVEAAIGEYDLAIRYSEKREQGFYLHPYYYYNRGSMFMRQKDYEKAIPDFDQAIAIRPELNESYLNRGLCHRYLEHKEEACQDFATARDKGSDLGRVYYLDLCY